MKAKFETLFNKNHIIITQKTTDYSVPEPFCVSKRINNDCHKKYNIIDNERIWVPKRVEVIKKESPLGFIYEYTHIYEEHYEYINKNSNSVNIENAVPGNYISYHIHNIFIGNRYFTIQYPYKNRDIEIGTELRPWDVADNGMPDHFVNDLLNVMDQLIETFKANKVSKTIKDSSEVYKYIYNADSLRIFDCDPGLFTFFDLSNWKCKVYEELFGNKQGPRFMTNDEKILSHGFDLKTSFRKM